MSKTNAIISVKPVHMTMCSIKITINEPAWILLQRSVSLPFGMG